MVQRSLLNYLKKQGTILCELSFEHADTLMERDADIVETGKKFGQFAAQHGIRFSQGHIPMCLKICQNRDYLTILRKYWRENSTGRSVLIQLRMAITIIDCRKMIRGEKISNRA